MRRCEDEKMRYRPPLLEEPCAQTLSGKKLRSSTAGRLFFSWGFKLAVWQALKVQKLCRG